MRVLYLRVLGHFLARRKGILSNASAAATSVLERAYLVTRRLLERTQYRPHTTKAHSAVRWRLGLNHLALIHAGAGSGGCRRAAVWQMLLRFGGRPGRVSADTVEVARLEGASATHLRVIRSGIDVERFAISDAWLDAHLQR